MIIRPEMGSIRVLGVRVDDLDTSGTLDRIAGVPFVPGAKAFLEEFSTRIPLSEIDGIPKRLKQPATSSLAKHPLPR